MWIHEYTKYCICLLHNTHICVLHNTRSLYLPSKEKNSIVNFLHGSLCTRFSGKLHDSLRCSLSSVIYNDDGPLNWSELAESLFQKFIGDKGRQMLDLQSSTMRCKSNSQKSAIPLLSIQSLLGSLSIGSGVL